MGPDLAIARVAARQHRVVTVAQLREASISRDAIRHRVAQARLQRLWSGVYLVGPGKPEPLSLAMGAVLASDGVLSGPWAAWLWGFMQSVRMPIDVTVLGSARRSRRGLTVHRTTRIDATRRRNIPVTTPARTCLDMAETLSTGSLEGVVAEAQVKGLVRESQLRELIADSPGRHGIAKLHAILEEGPRLTRAESERRLLALLRDAGLPLPETNVRVLRYEADFLWREQRLIVEVDGFAAHGHRRAFKNDRRRNGELAAAGYRVLPTTWSEIVEEPLALIARIAAALARAA